MSSKRGEITKEISTIETTMFLVRGDGEEMFVVDSEEDAKRALGFLAAHDAKILKKKRTKVFLESLEDGKKIVLSTQRLGKYIYNSAPSVAVTFDFIPVKKATVKNVSKSSLLTPEQLEKTVTFSEENKEICI